MRGYWSLLGEGSIGLFDMRKDDLVNKSWVDLSVQLLPILLASAVILGAFYSSGQSSIIGNEYLQTFSYADTLFQAFYIVQQIVIVSVAGLLLLVGTTFLVFIVYYLFILTVWLKKLLIDPFREAKYTKLNNALLEQAHIDIISLATMKSPSADRFELSKRIYISSRKTEVSSARVKEASENYRETLKDFLLLKWPEVTDESKQLNSQKLWFWVQNNWYSRKFMLPYILTLFLGSWLLAIYKGYQTQTTYSSWMFVGVLYSIPLVIQLLNFRIRAANVRPSRSDKVLGFCFTTLFLAVFMFALGRDDAEANIHQDKIVSVYVNTGEYFCGSVIANNTKVLAIYRKDLQGHQIINWSSVVTIEPQCKLEK